MPFLMLVLNKFSAHIVNVFHLNQIIMKKVNKITCENGGGFAQKFKVVWKEGNSGWSGTYPNPQSETIELKNLNIQPGEEVWIKVSAILGKTKESSDHVAYDPNCDDGALYKTTGATLTYKIKLMN